jgi:transposase
LFLFNQFGDLERCALRPGNVHGADGWEDVLKPVVIRYKGKVLRLYFRADAAFASPDVYEYLENEGIKYAIRLPTNPILQGRIAHLLSRPVGRPPTCGATTQVSAIGREAGPSRAASLPKSNGIRASFIRASASLSPTWRGPPRMSSPSTISAAPASNVGVDGPRRHRLCQNEVVADLRQWRPSVEQVSRIGMDTSKHFFQLHGVNAAEKVVLRKKFRRKDMVAFFKALAPTVIGIEACGAAHYLARLLGSFGHEVKLIAPQLVKPYVKRGKNDGADAEALCEAMGRPTMRFVPVKTTEQQAALMMVGLRDRPIRNRTQLSNSIRGYAAEFGLTATKGKAHLVTLLDRIQADENVPILARELFAAQAEEYARLQAQIAEVDAKLMAWHKADECSRRLAKIPSVGPIGAVLLMMKTPAPELFRSGREFAAWIGLTPKDHSTAGKVRLGGITRAGDEALRSVLVVGATSIIQHVRRGGRGSPWIVDLLKRKPPKLAAVALANKMARIAWKLMITGESYVAKSTLATLASAA